MAPGTDPYLSKCMPSYDPITGKRLGGQAQLKQAQARRGEALMRASMPPQDLPIPAALLGLLPPPARGVEAVVIWAAGLNLRAGVALPDATEEEAPRLFAATTICRELGKLTGRAKRAEKALTLRRIRLGQTDHIDLDNPPFDDPVAICVWSFHKLAAMAYEAAAVPSWKPDTRELASVRVFSNAGLLPCEGALRAVADAIKRAG
mgnify:CR=1 FL=1